MDLKRYARVLGANAALILAAVGLCTAGAVLIAWHRQPHYEAHSQLFVSTVSSPSKRSPSETYQGGLFSQQRVESYANVVASPPVVRAVIRQLHLPLSIADVQSRIRASVVNGTVLIDVTVRDSSPGRAKAISHALDVQFPKFISALESDQSKITVTSPARRAASVAPHRPLYILLGVLLGVILGVAAAVLREILDRRIRDGEDASAIADAPIVARILHDPKVDKRPLVVTEDPESIRAEAYRRLRTNLRVLSMDHGLRSFLVSSAVTGEGKSVTVANLGLAIAEAGASVVLVDADMRRPRLAQLLAMPAEVGLSEVLRGEVTLERALVPHPSLPLELLPGGAPPPNPDKLLSSTACVDVLQALTERAEVVLVDAPALLPVSDAAILARVVSAVVLLARVGGTRADRFNSAAELLRSVGVQPLGVILNGVAQRNIWPYPYVYGSNGRRGATAVETRLR